ncbi:DUF885 domain-containing protein [Maribacter antarcticus]|uniref:DUF885 domain-containing protein n=1 Tax=Maribacter antarcticus TaxID=505250 RepID=UPI00047A1451|nr:DUF885 domain-containing protein [Maribacter antarcticus]
MVNLIEGHNFFRQTILILFLSFLFGCEYEAKGQSTEWEAFTEQFEKDYKKLRLPQIQLSFIDNIRLIKTIDSVLVQEELFESLEENLLKFNKNQLSEEHVLEYELMLYEFQLNKERISLEKEWLNSNRDTNISSSKIFDVPNGKEWYIYFLKKWVDIETTPDEIYTLGIREIKKVKSRIKAIQVKSGMDSISFSRHINDSIFFYTKVEAVDNSFLQIKETVSKRLPEMFPFLDKVPEVKIKRGTHKKLAQVPGFYRDNTMYYNYFHNSFNKRQVGWLYIHEAMPGHHYQTKVQASLSRTNIQKLFSYRGVGEGWAAYIEELGSELGAYKNMYDELGKWEWDIIRSVRVTLDIGLNYYGWSDEKALTFWQQHIKGQDDIAHREINRMKRWPAQVITYKYGSDKILQWKFNLQKEEGFNIKEFHRNILKKGLLPYSILKKQL